MMWIMFARAPVPDAAYWPGRRGLAAVDAIAWTSIAMVLLTHIPGEAGLMLPVLGAVLALIGAARLHTAVWRNHRYRFTTWKVGRIGLLLLTLGIALKLVMFLR